MLLLAGASGALLASRRGTFTDPAWAILLVTILLVALQFIYYNVEFQQWQGRYFFPALIPIALALALGLAHWRTHLLWRWDWTRWLPPFGMMGLFVLDIYLLFRVIVPGLSPG